MKGKCREALKTSWVSTRWARSKVKVAVEVEGGQALAKLWRDELRERILCIIDAVI